MPFARYSSITLSFNFTWAFEATETLEKECRDRQLAGYLGRMNFTLNTQLREGTGEETGAINCEIKRSPPVKSVRSRF